jgi:hypothetical protein
MGKYEFQSRNGLGRVHGRDVDDAVNYDMPSTAKFFAYRLQQEGEDYLWIEGRHKRYYASLVRMLSENRKNAEATRKVERERDSSRRPLREAPTSVFDSPEYIASFHQIAAETGFVIPNWDTVVELLEADDTSPVVISYSVSGEFPNSKMKPKGVDWKALTDEEKFDVCMGELRRRKPQRQLVPMADFVATYLHAAMKAGVDPKEVFRAAMIDIALDDDDKDVSAAAFALLSEEDRALVENVR